MTKIQWVDCNRMPSRSFIYFVKKDKEPVAAKSACTFALIGLAVNIVLTIVRLATQGN